MADSAEGKGPIFQDPWGDDKEAPCEPRGPMARCPCCGHFAWPGEEFCGHCPPPTDEEMEALAEAGARP